MEMTGSTGRSDRSVEPSPRNLYSRMGGWLTRPRVLIVAAIALTGGGLALGWNWLVAVGAAPLILSLAPCAAMCALGLCVMHKRTGSSGADDPSAAQLPQKPASDDRQLKL